METAGICFFVLYIFLELLNYSVKVRKPIEGKSNLWPLFLVGSFCYFYIVFKFMHTHANFSRYPMVISTFLLPEIHPFRILLVVFVGYIICCLSGNIVFIFKSFAVYPILNSKLSSVGTLKMFHCLLSPNAAVQSLLFVYSLPLWRWSFSGLLNISNCFSNNAISHNVSKCGFHTYLPCLGFTGPESEKGCFLQFWKLNYVCVTISSHFLYSHSVLQASLLLLYFPSAYNSDITHSGDIFDLPSNSLFSSTMPNPLFKLSIAF